MAFMLTLLTATGALCASAFAATIWAPGSWKAVALGIFLVAGLAGLAEAIAIRVIAEAPRRWATAATRPRAA